MDNNKEFISTSAQVLLVHFLPSDSFHQNHKLRTLILEVGGTSKNGPKVLCF